VNDVDVGGGDGLEVWHEMVSGCGEVD